MKKALPVVLTTGMLLLIFLVCYWLSFTVPPNPERSKTALISGVVTAIERDSGSKDIVLRLGPTTETMYYINRGMEREPGSIAFDSLVLNKQVSIAYYKGGWDFFGNGGTGHICEITTAGGVVYTEFSDKNSDR